MTSKIPSAVAAVALASALAPALAEEAERKLDVSGFVDVYYAYNFNEPDDHLNFFPGTGTSAKRDNEFSINLAQLDLTLAPAPVGFKLSLGFGTATDVVHAAELPGVPDHPDTWRNIVQASVQYETGVGRGLDVEAGVYPSHIGFEVLPTKDNWNYTRSWLGELSPYYQAGMKLAYPFAERWSGQLHLLNGWQVISDNNRGKSVGWQLAYAGDELSFSLNGIIGPELTDNDDDVRTLLDTVVTWSVTPSFRLSGSVDVAREERAVGDDAEWYGAGLYARYARPESRWAVALRTEYYDDEDGAISGTMQTLREATLTLEHRPAEALILKLEGRYDRSTAPVFGGELDTAGSATFGRDQTLVLVGAVASF